MKLQGNTQLDTETVTLIIKDLELDVSHPQPAVLSFKYNKLTGLGGYSKNKTFSAEMGQIIYK